MLLAEDCDLSQAPFIMTAQFHAAKAVLTVALNDLIELGETLPEPDNLVFLFSIGRCGTTLANAILNRVPGTFSLSEPHAYVPLAFKRFKLETDKAKLLIAIVTKFMMRAPKGRPVETYAIKFHSQVLFQAGLFFEVFPNAKFVFLYRDAHTWVNSKSRFLQNIGVPLSFDKWGLKATWAASTADEPTSTLATYLDPDSSRTRHAPLLAAEWAFSLATYQRLYKQGVPFLALRYDDLSGNHVATTRALLNHVGLPEQAAELTLKAFEKDSQEGTAIARSSKAEPLPGEDYAAIDAILARHDPPLRFDLRL